MGIIGKRATQRAFRPLKERFANGSEGRPGASGRDSGGCLPLKRFKAAAIAANWVVPRSLSSSLLSFLSMAGMEAFFIFLNFLCSAKTSPLTSNQRIHKRIPPPCHTATVPLPLGKGDTKALFN